MKNIYLFGILALILFAPSYTYAQAKNKWFLVAATKDGTQDFYINSESINAEGAWFFIWNHKLDNGTRYSLTKELVDCKKGTMGLKQWVAYKENGQVQMSNTLTYNFEEESVIPETIGETMFDTICGNRDYKVDENGNSIISFASVDELVSFYKHLLKANSKTKGKK